MQAVILAAGMGKRLKDLTQNNTKCMVKVNGVTLIERMLGQLDRYNLSKIVLVVGYERQKLMDYVATLSVKTPIEFVENPIFDKTNNIYSLALAKDFLLCEDTLLLESDLIFENSVLDQIVFDERETLALIDKYESWMDGTCVTVTEQDDIDKFVPGSKFVFSDIPNYYKTVNIYKFSKEFSAKYYVPFLTAYESALGDNEYYEQVLRVITMLDEPVIKVKKLGGERWYEIDDVQDLDIASTIFAPTDAEKTANILARYGGFWRYPKMLDFCYLVNPYFPPARLMDEMKANFETLIGGYPSGMRVNALLAGKNFGVSDKNIVVGNGAAELIKSLMSAQTGKVGFIRPTFEEYPNRYDDANSVCFVPKTDGFRYDENDVINFFDKTDVKTLVIINPDNPTGNYVTKQGVLRLVEWAGKKRITLVIDESFVDFACEENSSLICQDILDQNKHLVVVKSISKSYGVPGLRLGVLASGNQDVINYIKKDVAIWNINSFAEFYMQIEEKYKKYYLFGLEQFRKERARFVLELEKIAGIKVYPTQANYVLIALCGGFSADTLTQNLLIKHNILIKDLTSKMAGSGQYIRVAVRNTADNNALLSALKTELGC